MPMLATPIRITFVEQRVLGTPAPVAGDMRRRVAAIYDPDFKHVVVNVGMVTDTGFVAWDGQVALGEWDPDPEAKRPGKCRRFTVDPEPAALADIFKIEHFTSEVACANAREAMKAEDPIAALEACGIADGWLVMASGPALPPVETETTNEGEPNG